MTSTNQKPPSGPRNCPYLTSNSNVEMYESWLKGFLPLEEPNGQEALRLIMASVQKAFKYPNRQGNIKVNIGADSISYEITLFCPDPFGDIVTTNCVGRKIVPSSYDDRVEISVKDRQPTTTGFHPGIVILGKIPLYQ